VLIISHRGHWKTAEEKNTLQSFERSFTLGFGTETDIRDYQDNLVISHDIPDGQCMRADILFQVYRRIDSNPPLALNIKADGLQQKLKNLLYKYQIENYFVFDMSVPDALGYLQSGMNTFTRQSEYEQSPSFYEEAQGVWIDCFLGSDWINERIISQHLERDKQVCLVSPELHNREYQEFWQKLAKMKIVNDPRIMLCTDYPREAKEIFGD
jgi:hypothetical protein